MYQAVNIIISTEKFYSLLALLVGSHGTAGFGALFSCLHKKIKEMENQESLIVG